jgi:lipopolysaccharide biosynthesis glycosyltransferase
LYEGKALFMDSDMYLRADVNELFEMCDMDYYPVYCVHHKYEPENKTKMDGKEQHQYHRKNWSSLMMFNCAHEENKKLTPEVVNTQSGRWLHGFGWLPDKEADIGRIPEEWNWLDGHSPVDLEAKNVHFTTGGPWFKDWKPRGEIEGKYAVEWCSDADWLKMKGIIKMDKDYMI